MPLNGLTSIRYFKDNDEKNTPFPTKESYSKWFDFTIYAKITYLAVYTQPGTKFYLNKLDDKSDTKHPGYIVGNTGVYTIDVRQLGNYQITAFRVDENSMESIATNENGYLNVIIGHEYIPDV